MEMYLLYSLSEVGSMRSESIYFEVQFLKIYTGSFYVRNQNSLVKTVKFEDYLKEFCGF